MKCAVCNSPISPANLAYSKKHGMEYTCGGDRCLRTRGNNGTLEPTEPHPSAYYAKDWIVNLNPSELATMQSALASCAIDGNRMAEVCSETLARLLKGLPCSDRYILGLAWFMRDTLEKEGKRQKKKQ